MKHSLLKLPLGILTLGILLLGANARLGLSDLRLRKSNGRGLLQDDGPEPCLFLNGRIIPPCPQLDDQTTPEPDMPDPETPDTETPEPDMPDPETPDTETPEPDMPEPDTPDTDTTEPDTPDPDTTEPDPDTEESEIPEPPTGVDTGAPRNQTEIIMECRLNGTLAAPEAAFQACEALSKVCEFPVNGSAAITPLSDIPSNFLSQIIDNSCRVESIATCENKGREFATPECDSVLVNGPIETGTVCDGVRAANEIFESEVSLFCNQLFTPEDNQNEP